MSDLTKIQWTDATWNPTRGCSLVNAGCENCYAMRQAHRFSGPGKAYEGLTKMTARGPVWTGEVRTVHELLDWPLRKRKPLRIFVDSMSDLFHEAISREFLDAVFSIVLACQLFGRGHTLQVLTKRPAALRDYFSMDPSILLQRWAAAGDHHITMDDEDTLFSECVESWTALPWREDGTAPHGTKRVPFGYTSAFFPLSNVHLGYSASTQNDLEAGIGDLLATPAAVRFLSLEPLLEPIDLAAYSVDWLICGGESGPKARPCNVEWIRSIVKQCREAGVPCFVKQLGSNPEEPDPRVHNMREETTGVTSLRLSYGHGGDPSEWPEDLRVREFPK